MTTNTLPVRAVRTRTFLTPDGRYTVELMRPRRNLPNGYVAVEWAVSVPLDRTRVTVARGEAEMPRDVAMSTVDAMVRVLVDAWTRRVGPWVGDHGFDRLNALGNWAMYRRDARTAARSATPGYWGEQTATRGVRYSRVAWADHFGWQFPDGYAVGYHLFPGKSSNRD